MEVKLVSWFYFTNRIGVVDARVQRYHLVFVAKLNSYT